jgi:hypothetical protein
MNSFHFNLEDVIDLWEVGRQIVAMLNALSESMGFTEFDLLEPRIKEWLEKPC